MRTISKISAILLAGLAGGGLSLSAANIDLSKLPPPSDKTDLSYTNDIMPIFKASCFRCHTGQRAKGGIHLDSLDGVLKGGEDGAILTAGDGTNSELVIAVSQLDPKKAMPPKRRNRPPSLAGGPGAAGMAQPAATPGGAPETPGAPPPPAGGNNPAFGPGGRPAGPPMKPLTKEEVGLVRAWINQGAK